MTVVAIVFTGCGTETNEVTPRQSSSEGDNLRVANERQRLLELERQRIEAARMVSSTKKFLEKANEIHNKYNKLMNTLDSGWIVINHTPRQEKIRADFLLALSEVDVEGIDPKLLDQYISYIKNYAFIIKISEAQQKVFTDNMTVVGIKAVAIVAGKKINPYSTLPSMRGEMLETGKGGRAAWQALIVAQKNINNYIGNFNKKNSTNFQEFEPVYGTLFYVWDKAK